MNTPANQPDRLEQILDDVLDFDTYKTYVKPLSEAIRQYISDGIGPDLPDLPNMNKYTTGWVENQLRQQIRHNLGLDK